MSWRHLTQRSAIRSGVVSLIHAPIADSDPARYFSLSGARRNEKIWQNSRTSHEVHRPVPGARRRCRGAVDSGEEPVDAAEQVPLEAGEFVAFVLVEGGETGDVAVRDEVHLDGPACRGGNVGRPRVAGEHEPGAGASFGVEDVALQRPPGPPAMLAGAVEQGLRARRDERVGVDLSVRMLQCHTDFHTAVLETEDLLDVRQLRQLGGAGGERIDDGARPGHGEVGEPGVVVGGERDDLAAAGRRSSRPQTVVVDEILVGWGAPSDGKRFSNTTTS